MFTSLTRRSLRRMITQARHDELCCVSMAVETMASADYAGVQTEMKDKSAGPVARYMSQAADARDRIDGYLDELHARTRPTP